jgi:basic membrane protein A and related proteins
MKQRITILSLLVVGAMFLAACGGAAEAPAADDKIVAVYVIGGTLGDKSFIDSAHRGLTKAQEELGIEYRYVEASSDTTKIFAALEDAMNDPEIDIIIQSQGDFTELLPEYAAEYPDKYFVAFDNPVAYDQCADGCPNVYAMQYAQNEGSFLAGFYAGLMSETGVIGAVGGMDIPVINDFMVGYVQGAGEAGVAEENVLIQYAGSWSDPAKGKELALTMYQQGADIVFQVAGGTGEGVFFAAEEAGKWALGVDSDQALIIEETNPDQAAVILTSMLKNVDNSMYRFMEMFVNGNVPWGTNEVLGIVEGGVGLAYNKYFDEYTPDDVKEQLLAIQEQVINGEIEVATVY